MYSSFLHFILQRHIVSKLGPGDFVLFILSTLSEERHHLWEQHWPLLHSLKWLKFHELPRILSRSLDSSLFSYFKSVAIYWMRKRYSDSLGSKPRHIEFFIVSSSGYSGTKTFHINLRNSTEESLYLTISTRLQPDSWKGLLIYQDKTYMHFVNNLSLIFQRLCAHEVLWRKAMWKSRVKWSCSGWSSEVGVEAYNLPRPSLPPWWCLKGLPYVKFFRKSCSKPLPLTCLTWMAFSSFVYFQLKTVHSQLMLNMFGDALSREWW